MLTKPLHSARYHELGEQMGLCSGCDEDEERGEVDAIEFYRAPQCIRCTSRVDDYVDMEIQVDDDGLARWQCELCDDIVTWQHYREWPALLLWPTSPTGSAGSSATSTHSGSAAPAPADLNDGELR
jgi:hypothetical protein